MKMIVGVIIAVIFLFGCSFAQLEENLDDAKQAIVKSEAVVAEVSTEIDKAKENRKGDWMGWAAGLLAIVLPVAGRRTRRA